MAILLGTAANDTLIGGAGDDTLNGLAGADKMTGGAGSDFLDGGEGDDKMAGGTDDDIYRVDSAKDIVTEVANQGFFDLVQSSISYTLGANLENLELFGAANLNGTGNALNNAIVGNVGNNSLSGGGGDDFLDGNLGDDILLGGTGRDTLVDGQGFDVLDGGVGADTFTFVDDGIGDLIRYSINNTSELNALGGDTIHNFVHGRDAISLSDLFDQFNIENVDAFGGGFLKLEVVGNDTRLLFDRNGGGNSFITLATLTNVTNVTADDLITSTQL